MIASLSLVHEVELFDPTIRRPASGPTELVLRLLANGVQDLLPSFRRLLGPQHPGKSVAVALELPGQLNERFPFSKSGQIDRFFLSLNDPKWLNGIGLLPCCISPCCPLGAAVCGGPADRGWTSPTHPCDLAP